jgi:hypothetical protein
MVEIHGASRVRRRGLSLVETALAIPLLLLLVFGTVDIGRVLFGHLTLQHAVREAGRFAVTGRTLAGIHGDHPRLDSVLKILVEDAQPFPLTSADISVSSQNGGAGSAGGPGDVVTIKVVYPIRFLTPMIGKYFRDGEFVVEVASTFRNEFFPQTQWN